MMLDKATVLLNVQVIKERQVGLPLGWEWMGEVGPEGRPVDTIPSAAAQLTPAERRSLEGLRKRVRTLQGKQVYPGVLLIELVTATNMKGFRAAFLLELSRVTKELGLALVVDEVMTAIRCGRIFSYTFYSHLGFKPDFITVGKAMLFAGVVMLDPPQDPQDYWLLQLRSVLLATTASCTCCSLAITLHSINLITLIMPTQVLAMHRPEAYAYEHRHMYM